MPRFFKIKKSYKYLIRNYAMITILNNFPASKCKQHKSSFLTIKDEIKYLYTNICIYPCSRVQTRPKPSDFQGEKFLNTSSFGGEVKPSCKISLNLSGSRNLGKITTGHLSRPQFHLSLLGSLPSLRTQRHVVAKVGTSESGEKQLSPRICLECSVPRATSVP